MALCLRFVCDFVAEIRQAERKYVIIRVSFVEIHLFNILLCLVTSIFVIMFLSPMVCFLPKTRVGLAVWRTQRKSPIWTLLRTLYPTQFTRGVSQYRHRCKVMSAPPPDIKQPFQDISQGWQVRTDDDASRSRVRRARRNHCQRTPLI